MKNVCIIGNSHTAAIKNAYDTYLVNENTNCKFQFFAAKSKDLRKLKFDENRNVFWTNDEQLESTLKLTSGGETMIETSKFDAFLLVGLTNSFLIDGFYSDEVVKASLKNWYSETLGVLLGEKIFAATSKPVYLLHSPLKSNLKLKTLPKLDDYLDSYINGLELANKKIMEPMGLKLLNQPLQTIHSDGRSTMDVYSKGSIGLKTKSNVPSLIHSPDDTSHMNVDFGYLVLQEIISTVFELEGS